MELSALQMARMSRLLDEALLLDTEARSLWLGELATEDQDLESALRQALLPPDGQGGSFVSRERVTLRYLDSRDQVRFGPVACAFRWRARPR
jgi:hypothetical protein